MKGVFISALTILLVINLSLGDDSRFPDDFLFGSATSAYQVEGAWNVGGKGESIWDHAVHRNPNNIADGSTGDDAAKSYYFYKEDVKILKEMGMKFYRFSINWSRILPNGYLWNVREEGLQYYDNLINELLANDIQPMVTIYHWDLPQTLEDSGGWQNSATNDHAVDFARILFDRYADRVRIWFTFNEAQTFCIGGYGEGWQAPFIHNPGVGDYQCGHNVLISHARIYHLYRQMYYPRYRGRVGIAIDCGFAWPWNPAKPGDVAAADRILQFSCGWYAHPIYSKPGGYPEVMVKNVDRRSHEEGRPYSRLPKMSEELKEYIRGTADFYGLNYYTSAYAAEPGNIGEPSQYPSLYLDREADSWQDWQWPQAKSAWLRSIPAGFRGLMKWIKDQYGNPDVIITENGWSDDGQLDDYGRIDYYRSHLEAVLDAIHKDKCNVTAYTAWSLIDNFEWMAGYTERFGIYHVDFNDPKRKRTPKQSSRFLKQVIETKMLT